MRKGFGLRSRSIGVLCLALLVLSGVSLSADTVLTDDEYTTIMSALDQADQTISLLENSLDEERSARLEAESDLASQISETKTLIEERTTLTQQLTKLERSLRLTKIISSAVAAVLAALALAGWVH